MEQIRIDRLVLGGAGNRVHALLGVLLKLSPVLDRTCHHFIGTSAGSILATMLALGIPVDMMIDQESKTPFQLRWSWILAAVWRVFYHQDGLVPISFVYDHIQTILSQTVFEYYRFKSALDAEAFVRQELTFAWIHKHLHTTLEIQAMDWLDADYFIFNYKRTPNVLVLEAIVASCAIPLVFTPFVFGGRVLCDAAVFSGLPWGSLHDHSGHYLPIHDRKTKEVIVDPVTVGVCLESCSPELPSTDEEQKTQDQDAKHHQQQKTQDQEHHMHDSWWNWIWTKTCVDLTNTNEESRKTLETPSYGCMDLATFPLRVLHNREKSRMRENVIQVFVDPKIYGSKWHSLWPSHDHKRKLLQQGMADAQHWIDRFIFSTHSQQQKKK